MQEVAFGRHKNIGPGFKDAVLAISAKLGCDPSFLMAAMAFETGERFSPNVVNPVSGATGLIQFMPKTAKGLGTSTAALAAMDAVAQLAYVDMYLAPYKGRMKTLSDVYMTILWPKAVGKPEAFVIFQAPSKAFKQNAGLDANKDSVVTKAEAAAKVYAKLIRGMKDGVRG